MCPPYSQEAYANFLPPCYCETPDEYVSILLNISTRVFSPKNQTALNTRYGYLEYGTCVDYANCSGGVPWTTQYSMLLMSNADELGISVTNTDSIHLVTEESP